MDNNNEKRSFWTDAEGISIIDILSLSYSGTYLAILVSNIFLREEILIELVRTMSPVILLILGGYFSGQAIQQYNISKAKCLKGKDD